MKKLLAFALVFCFLFSGCLKEPEENVPEISNTDNLESVLEEIFEEEKPSEVIPNPYTEETAEPKPEENLQENAAEEDEFAHIRGVLEDLGIDKNPEEIVISGNNGTRRIELIEDFIAAVENNESAKVCGIMAGYTFPYYFELSYEPDGVIKIVQYSHYRVFEEEYLCVFDEEAFYCFLGKDGRTSFSFPKMQLFWDEKPEYSEDEISDMPVTPEEAKETAIKILLSGSGYSAYLSEIGEEKGFGSYGGVIPDDFSDKADEYDKTLDARYEGTFGIDGKPYHLIVFYDGESDVGIYNYISAEDKSTVFEVNMVDGGLIPVAYIPEPRIMLDKNE